jgi:hypothetical protein
MIDGYVFLTQEEWRASEPVVRCFLRNLGITEALRACSTNTILESVSVVLKERRSSLESSASLAVEESSAAMHHWIRSGQGFSPPPADEQSFGTVVQAARRVHKEAPEFRKIVQDVVTGLNDELLRWLAFADEAKLKVDAPQPLRFRSPFEDDDDAP